MFIINLTPMSSLMTVLEGDIRTLPYGGRWSGIMLLGEDLVGVIIDKDLTSAFHYFQKRECLPFQALNKPVEGVDMVGVPRVADELGGGLCRGRCVSQRGLTTSSSSSTSV